MRLLSEPPAGEHPYLQGPRAPGIDRAPPRPSLGRSLYSHRPHRPRRAFCTEDPGRASGRPCAKRDRPAAPNGAQGALVTTPAVTMSITPLRPVHAVVLVDGAKVFSGTIRKGVTKPFQGASLIRVRIDPGRAAKLNVNGKNVGAPGPPRGAFTATFQPNDFRSAARPGG